MIGEEDRGKGTMVVDALHDEVADLRTKGLETLHGESHLEVV